MSLKEKQISKDISQLIRSPTYSRYGKTSSKLAKKLFPKNKTFAKPSMFTFTFKRGLPQQEIETLLSTPSSKSTQALQQTKKSACFLSPSRNQVQMGIFVQKPKQPGPTDYTPNYSLVKPRLMTHGKFQQTHTSKKPKEMINLPQCIDHINMECRYPYKQEMKTLPLTSFSYTVDSVRNFSALPQKPRQHINTFQFGKMTPRTGLPSGNLHQKRFDFVPIASQRVISPDFDKGSSRVGQMKQPYTQADYKVNFEFLREDLGKGVPDFSKMQARNEKLGSTPELRSNADLLIGYLKSYPRTRVQTPSFGRKPRYS